MRRIVTLVGAAIAWVALASAVPTGAQEPQQPVFRSAASAVAVDVSVRDRNRRPITGLRAADFEIRDNGVVQTVDSVSYGKLPIDVTIALDVSHSVTGQVLDRLRRGITQLMRDLGREDRLKLLLFNQRVARTVDFTNDEAAVEKAMKAATASGGTALLDAIGVSLVTATNPDRRQLVVFFTDGADSSSATTPELLTRAAQRSRATLTFVLPAPNQPVFSVTSQTTSVITTGRGSPVPMGPFVPLFSTLARETGGSVLPVSGSSDLTAAFRGVLDEFRSAYVLYFNAKGVAAGGYHTLQVTAKRDGATVVARRGYWY